MTSHIRTANQKIDNVANVAKSAIEKVAARVRGAGTKLKVAGEKLIKAAE